MKKIIEIKDINKYYSVGAEKLHALKDVNLEVDEGEFLAILGTIRFWKEYVDECHWMYG